MFELYTEKARRVVFYARYEASIFGSAHIETEHLLLGLLRESKALVTRMVRAGASVESIRGQIEAQVIRGKPFSTSVDLPLSKQSNHVLVFASEEADRFGHKYIGTEHLLLGLLREEKSMAATLLDEYGIELQAMRKEMENGPKQRNQ